MALIKCPECGKEISDKAVACINCGCPVSAMKSAPAQPTESTRPAMPVKAAEPAKQAVDTANLGNVFGQFFGGQAAVKPATSKPLKPVPKEMPEMKLLRGIFVQILEKLSGMAGLAGYLALGSVVVDLINGYGLLMETAQIAIAGIACNIALVWLAQLIEFGHAKKFIKKNGYEDSIRNDTPALTNSINAFGLDRSIFMAWYIKSLNPVAGNALLEGIRKGRAEKRKERLGYLPYLVILAAVYYLLPKYGWMLMIEYETCLIVSHVVTLLVMVVCGRKKTLTLGLIVAVAVVFAPVIYAYYISDMWYHILICAAAAFAGMYIGTKTRKKQ